LANWQSFYRTCLTPAGEQCPDMTSGEVWRRELFFSSKKFYVFASGVCLGFWFSGVIFSCRVV
jgi:hypothetical protein